ncbi:LacI family DNA-binding transcriptional regulator [Friedmanniella luteola]|uniref:LacI family DNA-binding transcriptional regulator n=1 Tax=Friedmanniella luteola TaxID=546871 RepID=UPI0018D42AB3|nr:LacI family DNA-binding transcriptional regulator [Friedmanniella luteola]
MAALAGVGIKTVSRVINDEANVSPGMRQRVQSAVVALNFQPHQGAGALRRADHKTRTLGLLLDAVDNPFSATINRAVEAVASRHGTAVFAASSDDDPERERSLVDVFTRRRVDGLLLTMIGQDHGYLQAEREQGTPLVFLDRPPIGLLADAVVTDNHAAARTATEHLLAAGHRRVAHVGDELTISTARDRRQGFTAAVEAAGPDVVAHHVDDLRSEAEAEAAVRALLDLAEPPTALFTAQNLVTIGALRALHGTGRQHEVALVGFDDLLLADLLEPGVTVMAQDPARIGTLAAERLFDRLGGSSGPEETVVVPAALVVRGSGEIAPPGR